VEFVLGRDTCGKESRLSSRDRAQQQTGRRGGQSAGAVVDRGTSVPRKDLGNIT